MVADEPDVLVGARKECPLVVGRGEGENFIASAIPAFLSQTRDVPARGRRRDRGRCAATASTFIDPAGDADRARGRGGRLGRGGRREGRLRDLHAQGDPRAAGRRGRDGVRPRAGDEVELDDIGFDDESCATCAGS